MELASGGPHFILSLLILAFRLAFTEGAIRVPSQVTGVSLSKAVRSGLPALRVTWTAPQSDLTISQYKVQYRRWDALWGSEITISGSPPPTSTILTGLDAGTEYNVRVRAVSAGGSGNWSVVQTERTNRTLRVPSQVTGVSLSKVMRLRQPALRVTWTTPQSDLTISQYKVQYRRSRDTFWRSESTISGSPSLTSTILTGLDAGTEYSVRVRAVSAGGPGNWSVVQTEKTDRTVTCGDAPPAPANGTRSGSGTTIGSIVTYTCNHGYSFSAQEPSRITLTCMADGSWNGTAPQCYVVSCLANVNDLPAKPANGQRYGSSASFGSTVTYSCDPGYKLIGPSTVTCLANRRWNTSGEAVQCIALRVPSQVTGLSLSKAVRSGLPALRVTWTTPQSEVLITRYQVQYRKSRAAVWSHVITISGSPPLASTIMTQLDAGTEYNVRVRAVSAAGAGMWSAVQTVRTHGTTPRPIVNLTKSALHSLTISWSVTSPQDVTSYIVFWLKESAMIGKSDALNGIMFTIENLLSNTAYNVVVQANGPLGSVNSTSKVFYTTPNKVQASVSALVLPKQILQVSWEPADDSGRSPINYIISATVTGMEFNNSTSVVHPMTVTTLAGLPQYSAGTVSVWAQNPGALSKPVSLRFRMVNIATNVTGVLVEWVTDEFTSLRVTVPEGGTYRISYSAVNKSNAPKPKVVTTDSSSQVANGFRPDCFYTVLVEPVPSDSSEDANRSVGIDAAVECNDVVTVGSFFGGLAAGVVFSILVVGIAFGVVKLRQLGKSNKSTKIKENDNTYDTVGPKVSAALSDHVAMETNPAYASVL